MKKINIHEAKTHLSRLIDEAAQGESFAIATLGKPLVQVVALGLSASDRNKRLGFLQGDIRIPDDFDELGATEIATQFCNRNEIPE